MSKSNDLSYLTTNNKYEILLCNIRSHIFGINVSIFFGWGTKLVIFVWLFYYSGIWPFYIVRDKFIVFTGSFVTYERFFVSQKIFQGVFLLHFLLVLMAGWTDVLFYYSLCFARLWLLVLWVVWSIPEVIPCWDFRFIKLLSCIWPFHLFYAIIFVNRATLRLLLAINSFNLLVYQWSIIF